MCYPYHDTDIIGPVTERQRALPIREKRGEEAQESVA
jgi:hypothetical protein